MTRLAIGAPRSLAAIADRALDLLAGHQRALRRSFLFAGIVFAVGYWVFLTATEGKPTDVRWYWSADPANLYPHPEFAENNGYNYSPAFELVVGWGRLLSFDVFVSVWRAMLLSVLVFLAGPLTVFVVFLPPVGAEVNAGNIQLLLALAIVAGFRRPATWAFVLLTKVSPGIGLLWFVLRRQWRALSVAIAVTATIVVATWLLWPDRWVGWLRLLASGRPEAVPPYYLTALQRLPFAVAFVVLGAWRGWRWPVVVGATLALPIFYFQSPSMLVGTLPFLREAVGRWAADRRRLLAQASSGA